MRWEDIICKHRTRENYCRKNNEECCFSPTNAIPKNEREDYCAYFENKNKE